MNICLVSREYPTEDHTGGIATYTEKTARTLVRLGQTVTVITESARQPGSTNQGGITVIQLPVPRKGWSVVGRSFAVAQAIKSLPRKQDIVQACEYRAEAFWYALRGHSQTRLVTRLATPSALVAELNGNETQSRLRNRLVNSLERLQTQRSDAIISPTEALADLVCQRWGIPRERVTTMRTGVDFALRFESSKHTVPADLVDRQYLLYFGRLEERKGVHVLAQALPRVLAAHQQLHIVFAGSVQQFRGQSLRTFIEQCNEPFRDRLHFLPRMSQDELHPLLDGALAVVLPSLWENLANTCLEALDMGKPVIATLGCGFGEVIDDGECGLLVPPGDVAALEDALLRLLSDPARIEKMSQAARARAEYFGLDKVTDRLLAFYEALLQRHSPDESRDTGEISVA
jgi:glycogen(starch) synthase